MATTEPTTMLTGKELREIVTDGGAERALLWECDSVHPVDAECKPWGGRDD